MALRGQGALAIWNGIAGGVDADFIEWHVKEHMPERVGLPGFISGRRYTAVDGEPRYFNFYEVEEPSVLRSAAYLARLNDPSPWTRRVVANFTQMSRTLCRVAASHGLGVGGFVDVMCFAALDDPRRACDLVSILAGATGVSAAHLFLREDGPEQVTSETRLRGAPDLTWAAVLIAEMATLEAARFLRGGAASDAALARGGMGPPQQRGLYRLDYLVGHQELAAQAARSAVIGEEAQT